MRPALLAMQLRALALLLVTAACSSSTEPEVRLAAFDVLGHLFPPLAHTLRLEDRELVIEGSIRTPCLGYDATAALLAIAHKVELIVGGQSTGQCPWEMVGDLSYRAAIRGMRGERRVTVHHTWLDAAWPDTVVVDTTIVIP